MGKKEKLIQKLKSQPKDFTFSELETLLKQLGYTYSKKGKTSGSRVEFIHKSHGSILLHKPHPQNELLPYQIRKVLKTLEQEGLI